MIPNQQDLFESAIDSVLSSWTALDLAVSHFDGQYREAQRRRDTLLESLSDSIRPGQYSEIDIAEFINEYMLEQFSLELDDNSHHEIAKLLIESWNIIRQGHTPRILKRSSGAALSVTNNLIEEVACADGEDVEMDLDDTVNHHQGNHHPRITVDEDGWSTVLPK